MLGRPLRVLLALALLGSAAAPVAADALDDKIARAHFMTGQDYYNAGRYEQAVREFLEAYRLSRRIDLLFNISLCYEKLGDPGRVTTYLRRYLAARPDAKERSKIETQLEAIAPRVGTLVLHADDPGTELLVDGEGAGIAPVDPLTLTAGRHRVEARFRDSAPVTVEIDLLGGRTTELRLTPAAALPGAAPPPTTQPAATAAPAPQASQPPLPPPSGLPASPAPKAHAEGPPAAPPPLQSPPRKRTWLWGLIGGGGALVVGAVVLGVALGTGGTNFSAQARSTCGAGDCTLIEVGP